MTPRRRVLMTVDAVGGVWTYACELVAGLAPLGTEVVIATLGPRPDAAQLADLPPGTEIEQSDFPLEWMPGSDEGVAQSAEWLLELERRYRPDIVHLNGYAHAALPWRAPVLAVGHSCVASWFEAVHGCATPPEYSSYVTRTRTGLAAAQAVVAPSRAMLAALDRHYGLPRGGHVISNGRCLPAVSAEKEPYVLGAGRLWDEAKNIRALDLAAEGLAWPTYVAGPECSPSGEAIRLTSARPLGALGFSALAKWLESAAIFAAPALYEPFGLSILEAAWNGAALVLGDIDSLRETWDTAAMFVDPRDPEALHRALHQLIDEPHERGRLGAAAAARARRYSRDRMAVAYAALYRELGAAAEAAA